MGTTDKSDKPNKDQNEAAEASDKIEDAQIVEEVSADETSEAIDDVTEDTPEETSEGEAPEQGDVAEETEEDSEISEGDTGESGADTEVSNADDVVAEPEAVSEPVSAKPAQDAPRRGGFMPMVLGGAVAAVIGFGGAIYFADQLGLGGDTKAAITELTAKLEAQSATLAELDTELGASGNAALAAQTAAEAAAGDLNTLRAMLGRLQHRARHIG